MKASDLYDELDALAAADTPSTQTLRDEIVRSIAARIRRRQSLLVVTSTATVVAMVTGISLTIVSSGARTTAASTAAAVAPPVGGPATPAWDQPATVALPAGTKLIPYLTRDIVTPVTSPTTASAGYSMTWSANDDEIDLQWAPKATASDPTAQDTRSGETVVTTGLRGYTITSDPTVAQMTSPKKDQQTAAPVSTMTVTVGNRSATLSSTTQPPSSELGVQSDTWVSWQLVDGRFIHVWTQDPKRNSLLQFAGSLQDRSMTLPRHISIGVTLPGVTRQGGRYLGTAPSALNPASISLCPPGASPMSDTLTAANACLTATAIHGGDVRSVVEGISEPVEFVHVDSVDVYTYPKSHFAVVCRSSSTCQVILSTPEDDSLSAQEIAIVASSVRVDPDIL